jgi:hypothetical protein
MLYKGDKIDPKIPFSNYLQTTYNILVGRDVFGKEETDSITFLVCS